MSDNGFGPVCGPLGDVHGDAGRSPESDKASNSCEPNAFADSRGGTRTRDPGIMRTVPHGEGAPLPHEPEPMEADAGRRISGRFGDAGGDTIQKSVAGADFIGDKSVRVVEDHYLKSREDAMRAVADTFETEEA